ncbi:MAG: leucine-rich repeat domain-containing protein [Candidatus Lokiarchaeota archaeon]|nr:leucine-rich repeat domain-containing protein [Candidatus Lokiarchaeota archaeon]
MESLRELRCSDNKIKSLPGFFSKLSKLNYFIANNNCLTEFPDVLLDLPILRSLELSGNQIKKFPKRVGKGKHVGKGIYE